jgi:glycosyltransferase involved in cell wall biosynthesis
LKITYVYADSKEEWNCSEWRCAIPARAINGTSIHQADLISIADFVNQTPEARQTCEAADVIVVQRNLFGGVLSAIQHWKARDKTVIADFDDAYNYMPPTVKNYSFWIQGVVPNEGENGKIKMEKVVPSPLTQFKWGLKLVHAATVPSKRLADDWSAFCDIHYLPNYIDLENYENVTHNPHDGVIIGWGGSLSHLQSFIRSGVLEALKRVCRARKQVKVLVCGGDRRIYNKIPLPQEQKILAPWVPYSQWPNQLAQFDIGIAPLYGKYDDRRSWIKVLEYMVLKIPWVASESPAYQDLRPNGWLVKNNPSAWERVLLDMVDHLDDYKAEAARGPYLFGLSQGIVENVDKLIDTYTAIAGQEN